MLGKTELELASFVLVALGKLDAALQPLSPPHHHTSLAVLDQSLGPDLLGTDLVTKLRDAGFCGAICILTVSIEEENGWIRHLPGVNCVIEKGKAANIIITVRSETDV